MSAMVGDSNDWFVADMEVTVSDGRRGVVAEADENGGDCIIRFDEATENVSIADLRCSGVPFPPSPHPYTYLFTKMHSCDFTV